MFFNIKFELAKDVIGALDEFGAGPDQRMAAAGQRVMDGAWDGKDFPALLAGQARRGERTPESIDEAAISANLYTAGIPDPDLLIRTSGEMRVSNFLLWQIAYAELYVTPTLWPDFKRTELLEALLDYQRRDRRFGGLGETPVAAADSTAESDSIPVR